MHEEVRAMLGFSEGRERWVSRDGNVPDTGRCGFYHCQSGLKRKSGILGQEGFIRVLNPSSGRNGGYFLKCS